MGKWVLISQEEAERARAKKREQMRRWREAAACRREQQNAKTERGFKKFLRECCVLDRCAFEYTKVLITANEKWARTNDQFPIFAKQMAGCLRAAGCLHHNRCGRMGWRGIRLIKKAGAR